MSGGVGFDARIIMNGAVAVADDTIVYSRLIPYNIARPLLMACDQYGLKTASQGNVMHYSNFTISDELPFITSFQIVNFSKHEKDAEKLYMVIRNRADVQFIEKHFWDTTDDDDDGGGCEKTESIRMVQ